MLVFPWFDGDDDDEVAWKQHDVYRDALGIIVRKCNLFALRARALLDDTAHPDWGTVERFDHRTLQAAHDVLAAVWRFRHDARQFELSGDVLHPRRDRPLVDLEPSVEPQDPLVEVPGRWLDWLRGEVDGWLHSPHLVRSVQLVLANQNEPAGYVAESQLTLDLLDRFEDVPWKPELCAVAEADLAESRARLEWRQVVEGVLMAARAGVGSWGSRVGSRTTVPAGEPSSRGVGGLVRLHLSRNQRPLFGAVCRFAETRRTSAVPLTLVAQAGTEADLVEAGGLSVECRRDSRSSL